MLYFSDNQNLNFFLDKCAFTFAISVGTYRQALRNVLLTHRREKNEVLFFKWLQKMFSFKKMAPKLFFLKGGKNVPIYEIWRLEDFTFFNLEPKMFHFLNLAPKMFHFLNLAPKMFHFFKFGAKNVSFF
jgi:hypothetical protein